MHPSAEIPLASLVGHRWAIQADASLEAAHRLAGERRIDFFAVLKGKRAVGICATLTISQKLSARYGREIYARRTVADFMIEQPAIVREGAPLQELLSLVFNR